MTIKELHNFFSQNHKICTDTRKVERNSIFFALRGENFDGNKFAPQALDKGCSLAVVDDKLLPIDERYVLVNNVLETLQELASFHRTSLKIKMIAITGTNGKTTTKELITSVLQKKYAVTSTKGNLNNHIGVPLTLLEITPQTEFAVIEMGANHEGEIARLCEIAKPDYGIITNVGKAHLEGFGSFEGVKKAKSELYKFLAANKGEIFVNNDNETLKQLIVNQLFMTYGKTEFCNYKGKFLEASPFVKAAFFTSNGQFFINSQLIGTYNFDNLMAAVSVGLHFNVSENDIVEAIAGYKPQNYRSQLLETKDNTLILDAYNANPTSMAAAIDNFAEIKLENKMLIIGDMLELGKEAENEHIKILQKINTLNFEKVFLVGKLFTKINNNKTYITFENAEKLKDALIVSKPEKCFILLKASRGIGLEKVIPFL